MSRYKNTKTVRDDDKILKYESTIYQKVPENNTDIYVITQSGDRLDLLANQFYQDVSLYWIIAISNPNEVDFGSLSIKPGTQLRIPTEVFEILDQYNELNQND